MNKPLRTPFALDMPNSPRETPVSAAFAALLPVLAAYIRAERDLEDIGFSMDPAYQEWHRGSEEAEDRLIDLLHALRSTPIGIAMDVPLRKMALLIHAMRCDPLGARALHQKMDAKFTKHFRVPGTGAMAHHRNLLLTWCRPLVADFASLPLFDPGPESDAGLDPSI